MDTIDWVFFVLGVLIGLTGLLLVAAILVGA